MAPEHRQRRRKISLACEPCRERKSRCDGAKPICSTCQRRSLPLHQCIYTVENARTASNEAYIRVLHERIQRLERACTQHGIPTPPLDIEPAGEPSGPGSPSAGVPSPNHSSAAPAAARHDLQRRGTGGISSSVSLKPGLSSPPTSTSSSASTMRAASLSNILSPLPQSQLPHQPPAPGSDSLDATEEAATITAMGTVSAEHDVCQAFDQATNQFYGSSSAASFMKETCISVTPREHYDIHGETRNTMPPPFKLTIPGYGLSGGTSSGGGVFGGSSSVDKFILPPRSLADYLVERYFERVYWLHPFFHKPTFLRAYESLWRSAKENEEVFSRSQPPQQSGGGLGLGSGPGADAGSIVFHSALNTIFAIGCQFSDFGPREKVAAVETFCNRGKAFVGLEMIDMHNIGVVQSLLLMTLMLQSTPFPTRCWNSVGVACRIAQGLGLHTESRRASGSSSLEMEIRRRTWHGCVVLDMIVSMTYGRPTMTAHLHGLELPSTLELDEEDIPSSTVAQPSDLPSKMCFYVEYIRECRILGEILNSIYQSSQGGPSNIPMSSGDGSVRTHGLDAILQLDAKLSRYEDELNPTMSWRTPSDISGLPEDRRNVIITQRTVLHGSFLYLRLMLHRPILTQLCSSTEPSHSPEPNSPIKQGFGGTNRILYTSFAAECAKICLGAAMDLIDLVHRTYQTNNTGGWWWDGLYAFTGGLAVIVGYLSPTLLASLDRNRLERSWMLCQEILAHFASFSLSANRSLKLLQKVHRDVMSRLTGVEDSTRESARQASSVAATTGLSGESSVTSTQRDEAGIYTNGHHPSFNAGSGFQWQVPADGELDMIGGGSFFPWDHMNSMDFVSGLQGMELMQ
ncbi:fungal-specific transcription factor domain-containing protein [Cladorrhinum sp. PSN259]|nr:fungal-specific transcription factor domain-containing protein [Cladorrhinum sp. PSN259]